MSATAEERLARIEAQLAGLNQRLDEVVISQLKDHGKRLAALERRQVWIGGWIAGAGAVGVSIGAGLSYLVRFLGGL